MGAFDRGIEFQLTLRDVTLRALVVADLRPSGVILTRCKVDVVVARTAGGRRRPGQISCRLGRLGVLLMARFTAADVGRIYHRRPIGDCALEPNDLIRVSGLHTRKLRTHMDLVNHYFKIDRIPGIRIERLGLMA